MWEFSGGVLWGLGGEGTGLNDQQLNEGPAHQVRRSGGAPPGGRHGCGHREWVCPMWENGSQNVAE